MSQHGHLSSPGKFHVDKVSTHAPSDAIIISDAHLLFHGDFKRSGVDLILSGGDHEVVLPDYFKGEKRAALASPDGAYLTGDLINTLSGHTQFAQADGSASVAPAIIGHVTKLTGNATAIRNGVSIVLNQGDTVHKGDVVQSGSDSTLGITFIDGTVFGLASNARMVLNEMVYDPNGSDNKSLLSLVQGTISFVAGATAKKGDMKVDTPVATMGIRGTAVLVEIDFEVPGQGAAPPAKFQVLVEPDGTTGSYILYDKTTLTQIATVNRAGTQTIINGQGAVSFQSSVQLSPDAQKIISDVFSLKFSDLNNPNTKLTTNFTDTIVPQNIFLKLASNDPVAVSLQFIIIPDKPAPAPPPGPTEKIVHIPGPPEAGASGGTVAELIGVTGNATVNSASGGVNYLDINVGDTPSVSAQFSAFTYKNANGADVTATLTAQQLTAIKAVEVPLAVVQDPNGKNFGTATWTYNVQDGAFDFLAAGERLTLTYMARVENNYAPNNEMTFVPITIVITGTNDKPTISATGGEITEQIGTGNTEYDTVSGTVTFADVDLTDRPVVSAAISTTDPFRYYDAEGHDITATLTPEQLEAILAVEVPLSVVQAAGNTNNGTATWTYSIEDSKFDFLAEGETLTLNYVAKVDDGHGGVVSTPITVTIKGADVVIIGTNDDPTIDTTSAAFAEFSNADQPNPTGSDEIHVASGTISFTDVDLTDRPVASAAFASFSYLNACGVNVTSHLTGKQLEAIAAIDGPLAVVQAADNTNNGSASWSYSAADGAFDFLADGEILTLTYTATVDDAHGGVVTKPITITITGSNDTAEITSDPQIEIISEKASSHGSEAPDTATGAITFVDPDLSDTHQIKITGVHALGVTSGLANGTVQLSWLTLGALSDATNGVQGSQHWSFSAPDSNFDYLAKGESVTLTYTVEIDDKHGGVVSQDVVVTINGSNDAPEIAAIAQTGLTERTDSEPLTTTIPVNFTDLDLSDVGHTAVITGAVASGVTAGLGLDAAALMALVTPGTVTKNSGSTSGAVDLSFSAASAAFDYLAKGEVLTLTYTVAIDDGDGGVTSKTFVINITGTNDDPVVASADVTGAVTEQVTPAGNLTDTGTIALADVDLTDTHFISPAITASAGALGTITATVSPDTVNGTGGVITWSYSVPDANVEYLAKGETRVEHFTISVDDGHGGMVERTIDVTITGTNDAPVVNAIAQTDLAEQTDTAPLTATIPVSFTDVDLKDVGHAAAITDVVASGDTAGLTLDHAALIALVTPGAVSKASGSSSGSVGLSFSAASTAFDYLPQGKVLTLTYTVAIDDGDGGITPKSFVITVTGTNDAPSIVGEVDPAAQTVIVAAPTSKMVLAQGVNLNSLGLNTETFNGISAGSASNNGFEHGNFQSTALGATFSASGHAGVVNGSSSVTAAPFVGPLPGERDKTNYLSIGGNSSETISFTSEKNAFGLYWGSLDPYNTIKFYDGLKLVASYTGDDLAPLFPSGNQSSFTSNGYVQFSNLPLFNKVVLGSSSNAFEIDNISAGYVPAPGTGLSGPIKGTMSVHDGDVGDMLTAFVAGNATIEYNGSASIPGNIDISSLVNAANVKFNSVLSNGGTAVLDWTYQPINANFDFLHAGDILKIKFVAEVDDGHGHAGNQALTITLVGTTGTTSGSSSFTSGPVVAKALSATENVDEVAAQNDSSTDNAASGSHAATAQFVFSEAGQEPVVLTGTSGKDVLFATSHNDVLTGGASADRFVFAPESNVSQDTITDFRPGEDHIDLRKFAEVDSDNIGAWLASHAAATGADTVITLATHDAITLKNVAPASLHASDFIVSPHH
ncbi:VCBS domain-containing protein [Bradyrhizobium sp.]|uniref:VCBS domain-containing protein n=1 Tax=Bradyrhizobium sp. TaxID=376 RepID=UPI002D10BC32|nr:VCBS domain-containing protein [Bradyrhizobium sp.]HMM92170.1 VCBS domain-containing protein [Bradyrhizobium sp.]